jgi:hemoglobin
MSEYAEKARAEKAAAAARMAIDEPLVEQLVTAFYGRVRNDPVLGPVFAARVADWSPHLAQMARFWTSIAIEPGRYHGTPMPKHIAIEEISPAHFVRWLGLWSATVDTLVGHPEAAAFFKARAAAIAESLQLGIANARARAAAAPPITKPCRAKPLKAKDVCDVGRPCC